MHSTGLVDAPKVLADIVESLIGAIFLDCNSSLDITWQVSRLVLAMTGCFVLAMTASFGLILPECLWQTTKSLKTNMILEEEKNVNINALDP